jgi:uncharacterized protein (TIGR03435 family)
MGNHIGLPFSLAKKAALTAAAITSLTAPVALGGLNAPPLRAQSLSTAPASSNGLAFEVASVKPAPPPRSGGIRVSINGGPGTSDPGQITCENVTVQDLIKLAFGIMGPGYEPEHKNDEIRGPDWLTTARFMVAAKIPTGATRDDFRAMMQNLLAERFKLSAHRETTEVSGYALRITKSGVKMKPSPDEAPATAASDPPRDIKYDTDKEGFRVFPPGRTGVTSYVRDGTTLLTASKVLMERWAWIVGNMLACPVVDQTGLTARFDFRLSFVQSPVAGFGRGGTMHPPKDSADNPSEPDLIAAVESQLGLQLVPQKVPWYTLVVDHVEKPSEN